MILLDANKILRWFLGDGPAQAAAVDKLLQTAGPESIAVDRVTVAEVTYVLRSQGYDHRQVHAVLTELCRWPSVLQPSESESRALEIYRDTSLEIEDCLLIARAVAEHAEIATFDKALLRELERRR